MTIRRGDILWADLGMFPTTSVQGGVRPVIVVSNNKANTYSSVITVVPLTSRIYKKRYLPTLLLAFLGEDEASQCDGAVTLPQQPFR